MKLTDAVPEIKRRLPVPDYFKSRWPDHYREHGNWLCPFHNDQKTDSLQGSEEFAYCHAGCKPPGGKSDRWDVFDMHMFAESVDFVTAVKQLAACYGITIDGVEQTQKTIIAPQETPAAKQKNKKVFKPLGKIEAEYVYHDENRQPLFQVIRYRRPDGNKDFRQQRFWKGSDGGAGWVWGTKGVRRVLYRLPELLAAPKNQPMFLVEGEKDADNGCKLGFVVTTYPQGAIQNGAQKWDKLVRDHRIHEPLKDRHVVLVPDNDTPGRNTAKHIAQTLIGFAASVKIVNLPDLPEKGDISDFIEQHGPEKARELLLKLVDETEPLTETEIREEQDTAMNTPNRQNPDGPTKAGNSIDIQTVVDALKREITADPGAAFTPQNIGNLALIRKKHPEHWVRLKPVLKGNVREVTQQIKRHLSVAKNEPPTRTVNDDFAKFHSESAPGTGHYQIPETWAYTPKGIEICEKKDEVLTATLVNPSYMTPSTRLKDVNSGEIQYVLQFRKRSESEWKSAEFPKRVLTDKNRILELADHDCEMGSAYASMTAKFFTDFLALNSSVIPTVRVSSQNGWTKKGDAYLCGTETISNQNIDIRYRAAKSGMAQIAAAFNKCGDFDSWKQIVGQVRNYPVVMFLVGVGFTGPILRMLDMGSIVVDLFGTTSKGKTSAVRLPASIWGKPANSFKEDSSGIMRSWRTTEAALENEAYQFNDAVVIVDDTKDQTRPELLQPMTYMLAGGAGKARMARDGGRRPTLTWCLAAISTGENALTDYAVDGGAHARVVPIDAPPFGPREDTEMAQFVDNLKSDLFRHHGHAGPKFILWLMEHPDKREEIRSQFEARKKKLAASTTNGAGQRIAAACAAISVASRFAHEAMEFPWPFSDPVDQLWPAILRNLSNIHTHKRAFLALRDWLRSNRGRFIDPLDDTSTRGMLLESFGLWNSSSTWDEVAIIPGIIKDELKRRGYASPQAVIKEWKNEGWLNVDSGREHKRVQFRHERQPYICIRRDALERDFDAESPTMDDETAKARAAVQGLVESLYECLPYFRSREKADKAQIVLDGIKPEDYDKTEAVCAGREKENPFDYPKDWDDV